MPTLSANLSLKECGVLLFYNGCKVLCRLLLRLRFEIACTGLEHVPKTGSVILCSNHRRVTDPPILACCLQRPVFYMAKSELFTDHGKLAAFFLRRFGAFPVKRDSADSASVKNAVSLLEEEQVVGIFPQGGCVPGDEPFRAKAGVAMLAQKTGAPVLPVWINYREQSGNRCKVEIRFGALIPNTALPFTTGTRRDIREATAYLNAQMNALGGK